MKFIAALSTLNLARVRGRADRSLLHDVAYYTLNQIPKP